MQKLTWIAGLGFLLSSTALLAAEEKRVSRGGVDQLDINGDGVWSVNIASAKKFQPSRKCLAYLDLSK